MNQISSIEALEISKYFTGTECPDILSWKKVTPSRKDFAALLDTVWCPDSVANEFPDLFHHLLDVIENIPESKRAFYVHALGFHFINALNLIECLDDTKNLKTGIPRLKKQVLALMENGDNSAHLNLAILAACYYEPDLGTYIAQFYDT